MPKPWPTQPGTLQHAAQSGARSGALPWLTVWKRRAATIAAGTLAMVMAYGVIFGHNGLTAYARKRAEAHTLELQMQQLQQENERLQGHVARLQVDPGAIEHEARADLRYLRPDEVIIAVPVAPHQDAPPPTR